MLNENTIEFLGIWEELHNSGFNRVQFEAIKNGADTLNLVLAGKPTDHLALEQMKTAEGVTEELKRTHQMEWVQRCNYIHSRPEEIVLNEMVYN